MAAVLKSKQGWTVMLMVRDESYIDYSEHTSMTAAIRDVRIEAAQAWQCSADEFTVWGCIKGRHLVY